MSKNKDLLNHFGDVVIFALVGEQESFPYDSKKKLASIPVHIPHPYGRQLFKACMDFYIKESSAPMHTSFCDHPGYPELVVTFDTKVMTAEIVKRLIASITEGIRSCETAIELIEQEEQETTDDELLDEVDEDVVVEFDFEEEVKKAIKEPVLNVVQSLGGGMSNG
jgi:hypothetical protein